MPGLDGASQSAAADFATVDNNSGTRFGVILGSRKALNYYVLCRRAGGTSGLRIAKVVGGKETMLPSARFANPAVNRFFLLGGRVEGTTLALETDGVPLLSASDATFPAGPPGVLLSSSSTRTYRVDNFGAAAE